MRLSSSMYSIFYAVSIKNKKFQLVNAKFNLFSNFTRLDDGGIYHVFHIIRTLQSLNLILKKKKKKIQSLNLCLA